MKSINCKWYRSNGGCKNKKVRPWFKYLPRMCIEAENKPCKFKEPMIKPPPPPSPPIDLPKSKLKYYKILEHKNTEGLVNEVNNNIKIGYTPIGRPFFAQGWYHQAMIYETDEKSRLYKELSAMWKR